MGPGGGGGGLCDISSGCCSFTGPWTVTCSSLRMLRRVAAFCRPLRPVLLPEPPPPPPQSGAEFLKAPEKVLIGRRPRRKFGPRGGGGGAGLVVVGWVWGGGGVVWDPPPVGAKFLKGALRYPPESLWHPQRYVRHVSTP